ncbi:glycosyltransferase family 4 protein [Pontibacter sp. G13]|uniref:glycosyltransferase family 4 protein n=1 Tax=Pontibacter sp. G13 TaxID=3074898 RepID=UPI00288C499C|nr:glycosyltransferase family 4 protein [Pontibacter sp. G13]WNJ16659.1 glycosyltransferase family 4 protein [Pontibacter sp. G13]
MSSSPLKILILCTKAPWPAMDGGSLAMLNMIRAFHKAGHEVSVLFMNTPKHQVNLRSYPEHIRELADFHAVNVDTSVKLVDLVANLLFSQDSYHVHRFTSSNFRHELERIVQAGKFDIIQLETLFMMPYIPAIRKHSKALISYRAHNIEHEIWKRRTENEYNPVKKLIFEITANRMAAYERAQMSANPFDVLVPISGKDAGLFKKLGVKKPIRVCTVGMDVDALDESEVEFEYPSICYLGALDWEPNREGLDWFLKEVWPIVHARYPEVPFYIAGRRMPDKYRTMRHKQIKVVGEVESAGAFLRSKGVMVVPILSGSGMRVKIVEGLAYGKPIVATYIAAEGISARHGHDIMLADDPEEFAERVAVLLDRKSMFDTISRHATKFFHRNFNNDRIAGDLLDFYKKQLK